MRLCTETATAPLTPWNVGSSTESRERTRCVMILFMFPRRLAVRLACDCETMRRLNFYKAAEWPFSRRLCRVASVKETSKSPGWYYRRTLQPFYSLVTSGSARQRPPDAQLPPTRRSRRAARPQCRRVQRPRRHRGRIPLPGGFIFNCALRERQGISQAGCMTGMSDERSALVRHIFRLMDETPSVCLSGTVRAMLIGPLPRCFALLENVENILSAKMRPMLNDYVMKVAKILLLLSGQEFNALKLGHHLGDGQWQERGLSGWSRIPRMTCS